MNSDQAFDLLDKVANASGNSKQQFLHPDLASYLYAAYNPFKRYYLTRGTLGTGTETFSQLTWLLLEQLAIREVTGGLAQQLVNDHTKEMTPKSAVLFNRILNKDLRIGMGAKTINKVHPNLIPVHDVMLAKLFNKDKIKFPCWGSPKIDGVRGDYKNGKFYSRNGHEYKGLNFLTKQLVCFPDSITGELIIPDMTFQESSGLIRSDSLTPNAQFHIIDLPHRKSLSFTDRLFEMGELSIACQNTFLIPHTILKSSEEVMDYYYQCRRRGYEGAVIKPIDYKYKGTRSWDWMKLKQVLTIDLRVIELEEGKGKYVDQLGKAVVSYNGQDVRVGGGFSDHQRKMYWDIPSPLIGKIIEVQYMEETDDGSLRHPRFIQIREDKDDSDSIR